MSNVTQGVILQHEKGAGHLFVACAGNMYTAEKSHTTFSEKVRLLVLPWKET